MVDDDGDWRAFLADTLADEGFVVTTASDGRAACDCLHRVNPAVVITDVDMAGELRPSRGSIYMLRRVVRGIYPPRIDLEFRVVGADGTVEREGRRELRDNAYLYGKYAHQRAPLVHEKALLERWLATEFPSPK